MGPFTSFHSLKMLTLLPEKKPDFLRFRNKPCFAKLYKPVSMRPMKNSAVTAKEFREKSPEEKGIRAKKMPRKKVTNAMNR